MSLIFIYPITWVIFIALSINAFFNKRSTATLYFKKHWRQINIFFGLLFLILFINFFTYKMIDGGYFQLLAGDFCPFISLFCIPPLLFSKNKDNIIMKIFTPWALPATGVLMISFLANPFTGLTIYEGMMSYLRHVFLFAYGLYYIHITKKYTKKELWMLAAFAPAFLLFVFLTSGITFLVTNDIRYAVFTTGLFKETYGNHDILLSSGKIIGYSQYEFFGNMPIPYPIPSLLLYALGIVLSHLCARFLPMLVENRSSKRFA